MIVRYRTPTQSATTNFCLLWIHFNYFDATSCDIESNNNNNNKPPLILTTTTNSVKRSSVSHLTERVAFPAQAFVLVEISVAGMNE